MLFLFILSFLVTIFFTRIYVHFLPTKTITEYLRHKTFLYIHHIYFGIILIALAIPILLNNPYNTTAVIFLGTGLGLALDELYAWLTYQTYPNKNEFSRSIILVILYLSYIAFLLQ